MKVLKNLLKVGGLFSLLSIIFLTVFYFTIAPKPFQRIVYENTLFRKWVLPGYISLVTENPELEKSNLPTFDLKFSKKGLWAKMSSSYELSKTWQKAYLSLENIDNPKKNLPVAFKFRGNKSSLRHTNGLKKSLWIKTKAGNTIDFWKRSTLTNIWASYYSIESFAYTTAKKIDLMAPNHRYVNLEVEGKSLGVFHHIEYFDKYYLQKNERHQGDIFYLDEYENTLAGFFDASLWKKKSFNRKAPKKNIKELKTLLACIKTLCHDLDKLVRVDQFITHHILYNLIGSIHADNHHNLRFYLDPSIGKFEPIVWDVGEPFVSRETLQSTNWLEQWILLNPKTRHRMFELQNKILKEIITEQYIEDYFNDLAKRIGPSIKMDKYLGGQYSFSFLDWNHGLEVLKDKLKKRRSKMLAESGHYKNIKLYNNRLVGDEESSFYLLGVKDSQKMLIGGKSFELNEKGMLKRPMLISSLWKKDNLEVINLMNKKYILSRVVKKRLSMPIVLDSQDSSLLLSKSAYSNKIITLKSSQTSSEEEDDHFELSPYYRKSKEVIFSKGKHKITENQYYTKETTLVFKPGAQILLGPNISIHTRGIVKSQGTKLNPIVFKRLVKNKNWGTFSISGSETALKKRVPSIFEFTYVSGGSNATLKGVFYSGMLNCYHAPCDFNHCYFSDNTGDDALNVKAAHTNIYNSLFYKVGFDAADLDFATGFVKDNIFFKSGNDAVDLGTGHASIINNVIYKSGDKGVSCGERSHPLITANVIESNAIGVAAKDQSEPLVTKNIFIKNISSLSAYQKKSAFSGSHPILFKNTFSKLKKKSDPQSSIVMLTDLNEVKKSELIFPFFFNKNQKIESSVVVKANQLKVMPRFKSLLEKEVVK